MKTAWALAFLLVLLVLGQDEAGALHNNGASEAEWCLTKATKRIREQSMRRGNCGAYLIGYGDKHQKDLAKDAIQFIVCNNDLTKATRYLRICQCHNGDAQAAVERDTYDLVQWAKKRAPEIGISCGAANNAPSPVPAEPKPDGAACICQYSNGDVGAWFRYKPATYGTFKSHVKIFASKCENLSLCERFSQSNRFSYQIYTGEVMIIPRQWNTQENYINGVTSWLLLGSMQ